MSRAAIPSLVHPTARLEGGGLARLAALALLAVVLAVALAILLHFHDRFWWAPGEGAAALAALALADGAPGAGFGLLDALHALLFRLSGVDLVNLRYPLVALTLLQTAIAFGLLAGRGLLLAFAGALAMASLTFVQFLAPAAEWYALFLCLLIAAVLSGGRWEARGSLEGVGFLLALLFFVLPAGGAIVAAGVLSFLFLREVRPAERERAMLARGVILLLFAGLALCLRAEAALVPALLFGGAPLLLLGFAFATTGIGDWAALRQLLRLGLGALLVAAPFFAVHALHGTLEVWLLQVVTAVAAEPLAGPGTGALLLDALAQIAAAEGRAATLNGIFWLVLPLLPAALGIALLRALWLGDPAGRAPLPVIACFFAILSALYQSPVALFFTSALTLLGLLYLASAAGRHGRHAFAGLCLVLTLLGLTYQAGQPLSRGWQDMLAGRSRTIVAPLGLPRASLTVAAEEAALYGLLVSLIEANSGEDDAILALPRNPELAFLTGRRAALPGLNPALDLEREAGFAATAAALAEAPPRLLIYRPAEWRNGPAIRRLVAGLRGRYRLLESAEGFEVYVLTD